MPTFSRSLEQSLHRALALANERHHEYATLEHLLLALIDDQDAAAVMRACNVDLDKLRRSLTAYLEWLLQRKVGDSVEILTPADPDRRGCQLSLRVKAQAHSSGSARTVLEKLEASGVTCDWREPDVIRAAPVPLYNRYEEVHRFVEILGDAL